MSYRLTQAGFSLGEMMVSIALAGLLVGGAFQMYGTFNAQGIRQQQIADIQQNLRTASEVMAKTLRAAGSGLTGGALTVTGCSGSGTTVYNAIQFSNDNTYSDPKITFDSTPGDMETGDPDWVRVIAFESSSLFSATGSNGANVISMDDVSAFHEGDLFAVINQDTNPANRLSCLRMVTHIESGKIQHNPGQGACYNQPIGQDQCIQNITFPAAIAHVTQRMVAFRVDTSTTPATPRLMISYSPPAAAPVWQVVAENIEDLQIALLLANGTVCGQAGNSVDDPALCDPSQVRALRFTLVARSSSPIPGFNQGRYGGFEDEQAAIATDSYLRRSLTTMVQLRNME